MEQIGIFIAEYAEWIYIGSGILMLILLIYVLHRIKKVERRTCFRSEAKTKKL